MVSLRASVVKIALLLCVNDLPGENTCGATHAQVVSHTGFRVKDSVLHMESFTEINGEIIGDSNGIKTESMAVLERISGEVIRN